MLCTWISHDKKQTFCSIKNRAKDQTTHWRGQYEPLSIGSIAILFEVSLRVYRFGAGKRREKSPYDKARIISDEAQFQREPVFAYQMLPFVPLSELLEYISHWSL